jgi:xylonate dehydratase
VNRTTLEGTVNLVGENSVTANTEDGSRILEARQPRSDLAPDPLLPDDTRIWAALQDVSGGTWGGSVYDAAQIIRVIQAGKSALKDGLELRAEGLAES